MYLSVKFKNIWISCSPVGGKSLDESEINRHWSQGAILLRDFDDRIFLKSHDEELVNEFDDLLLKQNKETQEYYHWIILRQFLLQRIIVPKTQCPCLRGDKFSGEFFSLWLILTTVTWLSWLDRYSYGWSWAAPQLFVHWICTMCLGWPSNCSGWDIYNLLVYPRRWLHTYSLKMVLLGIQREAPSNRAQDGIDFKPNLNKAL